MIREHYLFSKTLHMHVPLVLVFVHTSFCMFKWSPKSRIPKKKKRTHLHGLLDLDAHVVPSATRPPPSRV